MSAFVQANIAISLWNVAFLILLNASSVVCMSVGFPRHFDYYLFGAAGIWLVGGIVLYVVVFRAASV